MAAAQMALAIEMDNRMKRKAAAMGVFLNVETQKKFLKMTSNVELQKELHREVNTLDIYREQFEKLHCDFLLKDQQNIDLERENEWLREKEHKHRRHLIKIEADRNEELRVFREENSKLTTELLDLKREMKKDPAPRRPGHTTFDWAKTCKRNRDRSNVMYMFERGCLTELHGEFDFSSCFVKIA